MDTHVSCIKYTTLFYHGMKKNPLPFASTPQPFRKCRSGMRNPASAGAQFMSFFSPFIRVEN